MDWSKTCYETIRMLSRIVEDKYFEEIGVGADVHEEYANRREGLIARNKNLWRYWDEWDIDDILVFDFVYYRTVPPTWIE